MKLLIIGHSYITCFAQSKYAVMKQLDPNLQVRIIMPSEVKHVFMHYHYTRHQDLLPEEVVATSIIFGHPPSTYILHPAHLWTVLQKFDPDHVHIEEDPHSLTGIESVSLVRLACPRATISFFIWDNLARKPYFPLNILKWVFTKYSLAQAELVVCGNVEAEQLLKTIKGYRGRTVVLPQLGIDPEDYAVAPSAEVQTQLQVGQAELWIGFIGRLVPEKGVGVLLQALARLQNLPWRLLLVGNGPLQKEIQTRWQPEFGGRLLCLDAVPHDAVPDYLKCLDIFVLPSYRTELWKEQFGMTLVQAMMAGVACIGSSCGAIPEVLEDGGIIVPECDVTALASALESLILSRDKRIALQQKAKEIATRKYTNQIVAQSYLSEFQKLCTG